MLIYKPVSSKNKKLPVVVCLHETGGTKDMPVMKELLYRFSRLGFMAVSIDGRYFGVQKSLMKRQYLPTKLRMQLTD
jgi:dienelactone hydrolase